jgi:serine/threonine protein kinase
MRSSEPSADVFIGHELFSELRGGVRYRLEQRLGEGGTATAFLATRLAPDGESLVVIKIILPRLVAESDERALTIIKKEAVALGRLNERVPSTPYVVRLVDTGGAGYHDGKKQLELPWIALEYVNGGLEGTTLTERVSYSVRETGFAFDPARAARAIDSLAHGLSEIHAVGVVHRDLSPGNVLCCGGGETELFKISDFGIARPVGLAATFGDVLVGTPGYLPLEQFQPREGVPLGPYSDIFSLAAIVFFMLTGEHYFDPKSAAMAMLQIREPQRRSLLETPTLAYELREKLAACQAIDLALARATAADPRQRPQSARLFADSLLPWIAPGPLHRPSRRWMNSMAKLRPTEALASTNWMVRHPPGDDRLVVSGAWNASGDCLAVTLRGLEFWDGTQWADAPAAGLAPGAMRCVRPLGPGSFLLGGAGAALIEYSRDGLRPLLRGPDPSVSFTHMTTDLDDVAVLVGERPGLPPLLHALVGKRWLRPLPVDQATTLSSICRLDDEHWLVAGRGVDARPYAAIYRPLMWDLDRLATPHGRALLACAGRPERALAIAVGSDGLVVTLDRGEVRVEYLPNAPDLAAAAIDTLGRQWAAGRGRVFVRRVDGNWECVWQHPDWQPPFVSLLAEVGLVSVMTVDGAVLESRSGTLDKTTPAL